MEEPTNRGGLGEFVGVLHCLAGLRRIHPDGPLVQVVLGGAAAPRLEVRPCRDGYRGPPP